MAQVFTKPEDAVNFAKKLSAPSGSIKVQVYKSNADEAKGEKSVTLYGIGLNAKVLNPEDMVAAATILIKKVYQNDFAARFNAGLSLELGQAARSSGQVKGAAVSDITV